MILSMVPTQRDRAEALTVRSLCRVMGVPLLMGCPG